MLSALSETANKIDCSDARGGQDQLLPPIVILAGGLATRLGTIAKHVPKALVQVAGKPFIDHQLNLLKRSGAHEIILCLSHFHDQIEQHVGDGSKYGLHIQYSLDGESPLGTGGALRKAVHLVRNECAVLYGDSYLDIDYASVYKAFKKSNKQALMTVLKNNDQWDRSNVLFDRERIIAYDKTGGTPDMRHIDFGLVMLQVAALMRIPSETSYDFGELFKDLIAADQMAGYEVFNRFYEIGTPEGLAQTDEYIRKTAS